MKPCRALCPPFVGLGLLFIKCVCVFAQPEDVEKQAEERKKAKEASIAKLKEHLHREPEKEAGAYKESESQSQEQEVYEEAAEAPVQNRTGVQIMKRSPQLKKYEESVSRSMQALNLDNSSPKKAQAGERTGFELEMPLDDLREVAPQVYSQAVNLKP